MDIVIQILKYLPAVLILLGGAGYSWYTTHGGLKKGAVSEFFSTFFLNVYRYVHRVPIIGEELRKVSVSVQSLHIYNLRDNHIIAARYWLVAKGLSLALILLAIFFYQDALSISIAIVTSIAMSNTLINKRINDIHKQLYKDLKITVSSIRQEYMKYGSVVEAIQECETGPLVRRSMDDIYNALTTSNGELQLQEFIQKVPFRTIQTLARICYNVNNIGDEVDSDGKSNFVQALTLITEDINNELEKLELIKLKFGKIENLPLAAAIAVKPIMIGFGNVMPAVTFLYDGMIGYVACIALMGIGAFCYNYVSNANNEAVLQANDKLLWVNRLLRNDLIRYFILSITPKGSRRRKLESKIKAALSRKTVAEIYVEKVVYFIVAGILSFLVIISAINVCSKAIYSNGNSLGLSNEKVTNPDEIEAITKLDEEYFQLCDELNANSSEGELKYIDEKETEILIKKYRKKLSNLQRADEVKRLQDKYSQYNLIYFHWWFVPICFLMAVGGWFIPNFSIRDRIKRVKSEAEEDFLQLQSLMTVIMNNDCDTLEAIEQLTEISKIHKDSLTYCMNSYPSNPELELARLASKTPLLEFKRFIGKLQLTVNDLSLKEAFSDLIIEREYITSIRKMNTVKSIESRRTICGIYAIAPFALNVVCTIIGPVMYLGISEILKAFDSMNQL